MRETAIVELDERGIVPLPPQSSLPFDLSAEAVGFANELTAEGYDDYLVQVGLTSAAQTQ